jgi:GNAT superfamily N-acetyltransferase
VAVGKSQVTRIEAPLGEPVARELARFWEEIFGGPSKDADLRILLGEEEEQNRNVVYLTRRGDSLAGTSHLVTPRRLPVLGGVGEVATAPEFRRLGISTELCFLAANEFRKDGGQALFLGTVNPDAARVYYRVGFRKLASANVMALVADGESPEAFLVGYFREPGEVTVKSGSPEDRIPMIPLLAAPHDWQVLDANVGRFSTRYAVLNSCMGLYPRYAALADDNQGAWSSAATEDGRVVGLSTARLDGSGGCQVDGFAHKNHQDAWSGLVEAVIGWAAAKGVSPCWAAVSVEDGEKQALFESLGFREAGLADGFELDGRTVGAVRLERA